VWVVVVLGVAWLLQGISDAIFHSLPWFNSHTQVGLAMLLTGAIVIAARKKWIRVQGIVLFVPALFLLWSIGITIVYNLPWSNHNILLWGSITLVCVGVFIALKMNWVV
jgi:hypothetical protein